MRISASAIETLKTHVVFGYPYEICGFLIAHRGSGDVVWARPANNATSGNPKIQYQIAPKEHEWVDKELDRIGLEVVGYYHSHPDHESYASDTDRLNAWPGTYHLVVSCIERVVRDMKVCVKPTWDAPEMLEESLEIVDVAD